MKCLLSVLFLSLIVLPAIALGQVAEAPKYAELITGVIDFLMSITKVSPVLSAIIGWLGIMSGALTVLATIFILIGEILKQLGKSFNWAIKAQLFIEKFNVYIKHFSSYNVQKKK